MEKLYTTVDCYLSSNAFGSHAINVSILLITVMIAMTGYIVQKGWCAPANCELDWRDAQVASSVVVVSAILLVILIVLAKDNDYFKYLINY